MSAVPEIETERLLLRGWRDEDTDPWAELCADDEVMRAIGQEGGLTLADAWREMAILAGHWALKGFGQWVLEARGSGELVGRAGLYHPPDWPGLEMGWTVARPQWGNDYAGEAARATMEWARAELGADHLISLIADDNRRSQRVAEKLGMEQEGRAQVRGHDLRVYGIDLQPRVAPRAPGRGGRMEEDRERTSMDYDLDTPEDPLLRREEDAAASEAGRIGGSPPDYEGDEATRPLEEGGEGEAEGFELAERDLEETASHGDGRYSPEADEFAPEEESDRADAVYGEPDEVDPTEVARDPREREDDPGAGPGIAPDR